MPAGPTHRETVITLYLLSKAEQYATPCGYLLVCVRVRVRLRLRMCVCLRFVFPFVSPSLWLFRRAVAWEKEVSFDFDNRKIGIGIVHGMGKK